MDNDIDLDADGKWLTYGEFGHQPGDRQAISDQVGKSTAMATT
jgi:hypothetical protein